jgi:ssDNA-binding Zn-finger/Zn-ribbon topoisomerase 1
MRRKVGVIMTFNDDGDHVCNHCGAVTSKKRIKYGYYNMCFICPQCGKNPHSAIKVRKLDEVKDK